MRDGRSEPVLTIEELREVGFDYSPEEAREEMRRKRQRPETWARREAKELREMNYERGDRMKWSMGEVRIGILAYINGTGR